MSGTINAWIVRPPPFGVGVLCGSVESECSPAASSYVFAGGFFAWLVRTFEPVFLAHVVYCS